MTTYSYTISLDDTEMIALVKALDHYKALCESEIKEHGGPCAPFWAHSSAIVAIKKKLYSKTFRTSSNNFNKKF